MVGTDGAEIFCARPLGKAEVIRVIHNAPRVGVLVIDPKRKDVFWRAGV
jgi:hypothetical protein